MTTEVDVEEFEPGLFRVTRDGVTVEARRSRIHGTHGMGRLPEEASSEQLRALAAAVHDALGVPLAVKAVPGTEWHQRLTEAGATAYQICPPSMIDCTDPDNLAWARTTEPGGATVRDLTGLGDGEVLDLWVAFYAWVHADWSPLTDEGYAREIFDQMLREGLDRDRSVLVERDGRTSAVGFVFPEGEGWLVAGEAIDPNAPHAAADVLTCLQAVVAALGADGVTELLVDGHVVDPHWYPALQQVPHVTGEGLHLLELR